MNTEDFHFKKFYGQDKTETSSCCLKKKTETTSYGIINQLKFYKCLLSKKNYKCQVIINYKCINVKMEGGSCHLELGLNFFNHELVP